MTLEAMDRQKAEKLISGAEDGMAPISINFGALPEELSGLDAARFVVLPIPYDLTSSYVTGSRRGPRAIIEASMNMELYDHDLDEMPARFGIHTCAELGVDASGPERMVASVESTVKGLLEAGKIVCALGGDHSITCGTVKAYAEFHRGLSVLQLDAHADLRDVFQGTRYSHACAMRRVRETVARAAQVGIRSLSAEEASFVRREGIRLHTAAKWRGDDDQIEEILSELGEGPVYVTCDLDVLDPAFMPATGTPEPGGLNWWQLIRLFDAVCHRRSVVGFDVVELIPMPGTVAPEFLAAKLAYKLMGLICRTKPDGARAPGR